MGGGKVDVSYQLAAKVGVTDAFFQGSMHFGGHASLCAVMALGGQQVCSLQYFYTSKGALEVFGSVLYWFFFILFCTILDKKK